MTDNEAAITTICAFTAGFALGVAAMVRERQRSAPQYVPTQIEAEVARLLEAVNLRIVKN